MRKKPYQNPEDFFAENPKVAEMMGPDGMREHFRLASRLGDERRKLDKQAAILDAALVWLFGVMGLLFLSFLFF